MDALGLLFLILFYGGIYTFVIWLIVTLIRALHAIIEMDKRLKNIEAKLRIIASQRED